MKISIIGLGFVGFPLYLSILGVKKKVLKVIGIEQNNLYGKKKIQSILYSNKKIFFNDNKLNYLFNKNKKKLNITTNFNKASNSDFIFICISFDINKNLKTNETKYLDLIRKYYLIAKSGSIIILNSTLPPGFTSSLIKKFKSEKIFRSDIGIVYSPERVVPGINYYDSIINAPRVFSSNSNNNTSKKIRNFFSIIYNLKQSRLVEFKKYEEAELCKILENTYRATNIAFIEEWGLLSEKLKINIYPIINAIKQRKTHSNIMRPGLGVGGYCLTKDPYFAKFSSKKYIKKKINFPFVDLTMKVNSKMHQRSIKLIKKVFVKKNIKKILLIGITYTNDVDDIRNSRPINILKSLKDKKKSICIYDPVVKEKKIFNSKIVNKISNMKDFDLIIFMNKHSKMKKINFNKIRKNSFIVDINNILNDKEIGIIKRKTKNISILGRGDI